MRTVEKEWNEDSGEEWNEDSGERMERGQGLRNNKRGEPNMSSTAVHLVSAG